MSVTKIGVLPAPPVVTAPASAHAPSVTGATSCADGGWTVDWAVGNDFKTDAVVDYVAVTAGHDYDKAIPLTGALAENAPVKAESQWHPEAQVHGTTKVTDRAVRKLEITVVLKWADGYINDGKDGHGPALKYTVYKPKNCGTPEPTPSTSVPASPTPSG